MERWNNRLTLDNLDLAKRYLNGELGIHVHLRSRVVAKAGRDSVDFCAIFQRERGSDHADTVGRSNQFPVDDRGWVVVGKGKIVQTQSGNDFAVYDADGHQELVFVLDVEFAEHPERVVRSLVRLGSLDELHRTVGNSLYFSGGSGFKSIGVAGLTREYGESGTPLDRFVLGTNHLTNKQVEGRAEVVDAIPDDSAPPERRLIGDLGLVDQISRIRLIIGDSSIRVVLLEPLDPGLEITEVMFGPFDLYPDPGEIRLASHD